MKNKEETKKNRKQERYILSLYKQHYLDNYTTDEKSMDNKCQYSCWGYYDGVDVFDIEEEFEKQTTMS